MKASTRLRQLMAGSGPVVAPGGYDGISAKMIERAGFPAVYASGGAIARSTGVPDLGLMSMAEITDRLATMVDAVTVPVIADADTGYGNALNAQHMVRAFERAGVAGFHLEDQTFPKRCGHYDDKSIVPMREMVQKIRAVKDAATDTDLVLIARTDGLAVEGFESTIERSHAYMEAGADVIFVEAPTSVEQIEKIAALLPYPKLINMFAGGKTPLIPSERLGELGYAIVIIPSDLQRAALFAMEQTLAAIRRDGDSRVMQDRMVSFAEREAIIGTSDWLDRDRIYAV
ncbi:isocitrate lyase/PEP mutase family protein [Roseicyclus mahoneyensis]|uniref:2-methylisocitrate lyase-like PEP mutase family enzyme n=1 Tax=Roseicyclus mahoneyensis TaxID=164332 RepID=A0A316GDL6_9RHOB|nr:oxaloacetate decarboxylase [Roseicyclus mahoneyensis]PWK59099.1 2-methylisocitrate lyase-like PEP mutase family enzyme [Roseicyclus mahoneyensis]